ncbi:MAG: ABC transporter ATP-binding protein, partial [Solirubrobacteraceae bacterium]
VAPEAANGAYSTRERLSLLIGDRWRYAAAMALGTVISAAVEAMLLALIIQIAAAIVGVRKIAGHSSHFGFFSIHARVGTLILIAAGLALLRLALQLPLAQLPARIAADVQARLRRDLFTAFTRASWGVQSREKEGHLQETMTGQVMQATSGAVQATQMLTSLLTFLVLLVFALKIYPTVTGIMIVATLALFAAMRPLNQLGQRRARALSQAQLEYAGGVNQANRLAEEARVFGAGAAQREDVEALIDRARDLFFKTQVLGRITPAVFQSMVLLILVGGLWLLEEEGAGHAVTLGSAIVILMRAGTYGQAVQGAWQSLRQSLPFIERLQDTRDRYAASAPPAGELRLDAVEDLAFDDVHFAYEPGRPVLQGISFAVAGGESVGVIGPSGAGKSTLIQILLRLRQPSTGGYLVNGEPAARYHAEDWHRLIAYVPQEPRLLHATVAENIRFFREMGEQDVERAARLANIHEEIVTWPLGYETIVGPRADAVSGGQQQRICLARALAARPELLVLDEPTSALDPHSESLIQESLRTLRDQLTLFVIAHRMSTLDICDRVMVDKDGRLVAFDTIAQLRAEEGYYRSASAIAAGTNGVVMLDEELLEGNRVTAIPGEPEREPPAAPGAGEPRPIPWRHR